MFENVVALQVKDEKRYAQYREAMKPILSEYGGGFRYDFRISEVLKGEEEINRVFLIYFSDRQAMQGFFSDPRYLSIKKEFFESSVEKTLILSGYERE